MFNHLSTESKQQIADAVGAAELKTSAEIKVIVLRYCWIEIREKARSLFFKYDLHTTKQRNAVLILVILTNREFLVFGDEGIDDRVDEGFWLHVRDAMLDEFRAGHLVEGICKGVAEVGGQLANHFPRAADDVNELCNEVIHED